MSTKKKQQKVLKLGDRVYLINPDVQEVKDVSNRAIAYGGLYDTVKTKKNAKLTAKMIKAGKVPFLHGGSIVWKSKKEAIKQNLLPKPDNTKVPTYLPKYIPLSQDPIRQAELEKEYLRQEETRQLEDTIDDLLSERVELIATNHHRYAEIKALCEECAKYEAMWAVKLVKLFNKVIW